MKASKRQQEMQDEWRRTVGWVFGTPEGRRFVWRLVDKCNVNGGSYTGEALSMAFAEGKRSVGISLMKELQMLMPSEYSMMVREQVEQVTQEILTREAAKKAAGKDAEAEADDDADEDFASS